MGKRIAVVAAGPLMNFLLAIVIYAAIAMVGTYQPSTKLAEPLPHTQAAQLGIEEGWRAISVEDMSVETFNDMRMAMIAHLGDKEVRVTFDEASGRKTERFFDLSGVKNDGTEDPALTSGLFPYQGPVKLVKVEEGSVAQAAGLQVDDTIVALNGEPCAPCKGLFRPFETRPAFRWR